MDQISVPGHQSPLYIELIEYGDLQCGQCASVYPLIKCLQKIMGIQLKFSFKHFPLAHVHPLALEMAIATEAAALQNKFWSMHDIIFENQRNLTRSSLLDFAEELKLDMHLFNISREHRSLFDMVMNDFNTGAKNGVRETPAFFINGCRYRGKNDLDSLFSACQYHLALKEREYATPGGPSERKHFITAH